MIYGTNFEVVSARSKTTTDTTSSSTKMGGALTKQATTNNSEKSSGENEVATLAAMETTITTTITPNGEPVVASAVRAQPDGNTTTTTTTTTTIPNGEPRCPRYFPAYRASGDPDSPAIWEKVKVCAGSNLPCDCNGNTVDCARTNFSAAGAYYETEPANYQYGTDAIYVYKCLFCGEKRHSKFTYCPNCGKRILMWEKITVE